MKSRHRSHFRSWIWLLLALLAVDVGIARWWWVQRRERQAEIHILSAARRYRVDPALVKAVVWRESRFRADARGAAGELGLMQVGSLAAREWGAAENIAASARLDLLDPRVNTLAGTWYLAKLLRRYAATDLPEAYALADYNAGRVNVRRWLGGPAATNSTAFLAAMDFPGTRDYIHDILDRRDHYRAQGFSQK